MIKDINVLSSATTIKFSRRLQSATCATQNKKKSCGSPKNTFMYVLTRVTITIFIALH